MPAYYRSSLAQFLAADPAYVLGVITNKSSGSGFTDQKNSQLKAWALQVDILRPVVSELISAFQGAAEWGILFEYPIPRRQKRVDVVMLIGEAVFCMEFKIGDKKHQRSTARQVEDYALDLRDFHQQSHGRIIVPIAVSTHAPVSPLGHENRSEEHVSTVVTASAEDLLDKLLTCIRVFATHDSQIELDAWDRSIYKPVPTIVEAAEALYAGHDVREIAHSHADRQNLGLTCDRLVSWIQNAQSEKRKILCVVTGVPGAGKTLAGLNVVHDPSVREMLKGSGVFLSGNGPLVKIVSAAITRDFKKKQSAGDAKRTVGTFIQNVHSFIKHELPREDAPTENLIVFDEAQRAWDAQQCLKKIERNESEPELIMSIMDRHDWAVVVALVGGGQEINTGEAGLAEWGATLQRRFSNWEIAVSPHVLGANGSGTMQQFFADGHGEGLKVHQEPALHLNVSLRSYKAEAVSRWVDAVIEGNSVKASRIISQCKGFHLGLTRDLATARNWLREHTRGLRRCGLLASSGALRLRSDGIELSSGFRQGNKQLYVDWFLNDLDDIRSSNQLEVAATEYECQGLELDVVGLCWGGDLLYDREKGWIKRKLVGSKWNAMKKPRDHQYLLNSYRVLMTRAREGLMIWVPKGDADDPTNLPAGFDSTAAFLQACGLVEI